LLIDEILAVGDSNFQAKCFGKLRELKAKGVTIILVTHDTDTVSSFCNKAIWLNEGVIQASGKSKLVVDKYREFMNHELYESMQAQEEKQRGCKEPVVEQCKENNDVARASETTEEKGIDYTANRFGLRHIEITKAGFVNQKDEFTTIVRAGAKTELRIYYKVNKPLEQYNFGMGFYTMDLVCIYGVNTELDGNKITNLPKEGYISFLTDNLSLLSGKYILQIAIVDGNGTPMDYYQNYEYFDVVSSVKAIGLSDIQHIWQIDRKANYYAE